jgi:pimeloyl-ACP methyl ester carboxylesterase
VNLHRQGSGPPLVLIHGVGHHWQGWRPVIDRLSARFDVIATDSPGFGRSAPLPPGTDPTIASYARAYAELFAQLGVGRPHVAGNSMGGGISLELARMEAVASATAVAPVGFWTPRERRFCQLSMSLSGHIPEALRPAVRRLAGTAPGRTLLLGQLFGRPWRMPAAEARLMLDDAWAAPSFAAALEAFDRYDFRDGHELAGVPVTVAWGSRDRLLLYGRQAPRARLALPHARHVTLAGLGHVPSFDDPDLVADVIASGTGVSR